MKNTDIPIVNNVLIPNLNKAIVRKSDTGNYIIKENKTFSGGLQCNNFYVSISCQMVRELINVLYRWFFRVRRYQTLTRTA